MQATRLSSRYFNFCLLRHFPRCAILKSNISRKCWKIGNLRNQQLSFTFCTLHPVDQLPHNNSALEKFATEPYFANIGPPGKQNKHFVILREEKLDYILPNGKEKTLLIKMQSSKTGNKWIQLDKKIKFANKLLDFSKIPVPEDAYLLVKAMDTLLSRCVYKEKPPICHELLNGLIYDYKIEIYFKNEFNFKIETIKTEASPAHKPESLYLPIELLPSLRDQMAKLLAEFDGTEQIGSLPPLPKWARKENDSIDDTIDENANKGKVKRIKSKVLEYVVDVEPQDRLFKIELCEGVSGREFIGITLKSLTDQKFANNSFYCDFPNISVPEDAYPLFNAMCALQNDLQEKNSNAMQQIQSSSLICRQLVTGGCFYDYLLEIHTYKGEYLDFRMQTIPSDVQPKYRPRHLEGPIPIEVFHWLKDQMTKMLIKHEKLDEIKNGEAAENQPMKPDLTHIR